MATATKRRSGSGKTMRTSRAGQGESGNGAEVEVVRAREMLVDEPVQLMRLDVQRLRVEIIGDSALIMHKFSDKAQKQIADKQGQKGVAKKGKRDPKAEYEGAMIKDDDGKFAIPSVAFKKAAVGACSYVGGITKVLARGAFHVENEFVPLSKKTSKPRMRTDMVRLPTGVADIRYRPEFTKWSCVVPVNYNAAVISAEQIVNLFNIAGYAVGILEWRPQRDGEFGRFHVAQDGESA